MTTATDPDGETVTSAGDSHYLVTGNNGLPGGCSLLIPAPNFLPHPGFQSQVGRLLMVRYLLNARRAATGRVAAMREAAWSG